MRWNKIIPILISCSVIYQLVEMIRLDMLMW